MNINKLSLNANKSKFVIFHCPQRKVNIPVLKISDTIIDCVENFDLLGITLNQHMNWRAHIRKLSTKIPRTLGSLYRLKYIQPLNIKLLIYNSLILSHLHYGILVWGYEYEKITKLQKKCLRILTLCDYKAHTEPLFKRLKLLKVSDIIYFQQLKFYYNYINQNLPLYFLYNNYIITNQTSRDYDTRQRNTYIHYVKHNFAQKYLMPLSHDRIFASVRRRMGTRRIS